MKLLPIIALFVAPFSVGALRIAYSTAYDKGDTLLFRTSCSYGDHSLVPKGYSTFQDLQTFPHIGGSYAVEGSNSTNCGTCWEITYNGTQIKVAVIDQARKGYVLSLKAMNDLTNGKAEQLGLIEGATDVQVDNSLCGLPR